MEKISLEFKVLLKISEFFLVDAEDYTEAEALAIDSSFNLQG